MLHLKHRCDDAETWTMLNIDQKYVESFAMRCFRRMEKTRRTDSVRAELLGFRRKGTYHV